MYLANDHFLPWFAAFAVLSLNVGFCAACCCSLICGKLVSDGPKYHTVEAAQLIYETDHGAQELMERFRHDASRSGVTRGASVDSWASQRSGTIPGQGPAAR